MRAIFLDRDGVICENRSDHVKSWNEFHFLPNALSGLAQLARTDFASIVVTNQAVINRGLVPASVIAGIHQHMLNQVQRAGGRIDHVMVCPHRTDEFCACRKPQPGLLLRAAAEMNIDLAQSYLIGDAVTDIQAGLAVGCTCFMVMTGRGTKQATQVYGQALPGVRY
ncbi:MAG TPA: HAD family hydrolase, partial [Anaerolineae bacterium]